MTGNVVERDAIVIKVVEDGQAELITLPVVWLRAAGPEDDTHDMRDPWP